MKVAVPSKYYENIKPKKLNLGCGKNYLQGYDNVDINPNVKPDILMDLNHEWDWNKLHYDYYDYVEADNVLEHVEDLVMVMEKIYKKMKPGAELHIKVPYYLHPAAWSDPTHTRAFSEVTFQHFVMNGLPKSISSPVTEKFRYMEQKYIWTELGKFIPIKLFILGLDVKLWK